jgi:hypothetical protein
MQIEYMLSIDDWVAFSLYYLETSAEGRRVRTNGRINGGVFFFGLGSLLAIFTASLVPLLLGLLALIGWYLLWPQLLRSSQRTATERRQRESQNPCLNGVHRLELTSDGLHGSCDVSDTVIQWPGIARIETNSTHGFVFLRNNTGYVIPREKVREGDFATFVAHAQQHLQDHAPNAISSNEDGIHRT